MFVHCSRLLLKVEIQERAVGAAHDVSHRDRQQHQNGQRLGDDIAGKQLPQLFDERGAADDGDRQQYAVVAQEVKGHHAAGRDEKLAEQQAELHACVVAHEHGPAYDHEEEGVDMGPDPALFEVGQEEELFQSQQHKIVQAPADEVPVRAVPDAGEQFDDEQVEDLSLEALAVAAEGDIHILPEPAGQRHVPAPPELGDGRGDIGVVEVLGEVEAQHLAHADAHQGVAGKVEIELERVGDDAQPDQRGRGVGKAHEGDGGAVRYADDVRPERTDGVGQQDFLCQAESEQGHAVLDLLELIAAFV